MSGGRHVGFVAGMTLAKAIRLEAASGGREREIVMRLHASNQGRAESGVERSEGSALSFHRSGGGGHGESDPHLKASEERD